jgi:hypothetical protein
MLKTDVMRTGKVSVESPLLRIGSVTLTNWTTTMLYIHVSGAELTEAVSRSLAGFEQWIEMMLGESRS